MAAVAPALLHDHRHAVATVDQQTRASGSCNSTIWRRPKQSGVIRAVIRGTERNSDPLDINHIDFDDASDECHICDDS